MLPLLQEENPKYVQHHFGYYILQSFLIPNRHTSLILFYISSTWVEIHVCLQLIMGVMETSERSTWVEIHVCLQHHQDRQEARLRSTWVEIHVCLQQNKNPINLIG